MTPHRRHGPAGGTVVRVAGLFTPLHRGGAGTPMVLLHGFTDTWRTWSLVLPALERRHDVLAVTLPGHAGGPPLPDPPTPTALGDAVEEAMDAAGFETAHLVGNSLGGHLGLQLAGRGRARTVVALAPAGGWAAGDESYRETLAHFAATREQLRHVVPHAEALLARPEGRRRATAHIVAEHEHLPAELIAHLMRGAAACDGTSPLIELAQRDGWRLDPEAIACPVRVLWGTADALLPWPASAARYRQSWLPHADWVVLDDAGHCLQLDRPLEIAQLILDFTAP